MYTGTSTFIDMSLIKALNHPFILNILFININFIVKKTSYKLRMTTCGTLSCSPEASMGSSHPFKGSWAERDLIIIKEIIFTIT